MVLSTMVADEDDFGDGGGDGISVIVDGGGGKSCYRWGCWGFVAVEMV